MIDRPRTKREWKAYWAAMFEAAREAGINPQKVLEAGLLGGRQSSEADDWFGERDGTG